ncbi:acyltransferase [Nitrospira sp.]|nr:acyltransferase [Nitrospira sp.]
MKPAWLRQSERGNRYLLRLFVWLTLRLGRPLTRPCLYPICLYFLAFSRDSGRVSRRFLAEAADLRPSWADVFRHYHTFASTIHDRVYLLAGRHDYFDIRVEGGAAVEEHLQHKRGCLLIGSHLGSFEVLRALGLFRRRVPLSVIMHEEATSNLNAVLHCLCPEVRDHIIAPGRPDTLLRVKECLDRGELVGMLGDRTFSEEKAIECPFLGRPTQFPEGPLLLAALLNVPVVLFFGLYRGGRRYDVHFEPFADAVVLPRPRRTEDLRPWVMRYVARLESYCRRYPNNWFNFYELPHSTAAGGGPPAPSAVRTG